VGSPCRFRPALNLGLCAIKPALTGNSEEDYERYDFGIEHLTLSEPDREVRGRYHLDVGITLGLR
jgi:hypothetical protein